MQKNNDVKIDEKSNATSAIKLFEQTSIFKSLFKIVFLAIVVSLASGIYVFADQILMVKLLPINTHYNVQDVFGENYKAIEVIKNKGLDHYINTDVASVVRTAISLSSPLTIVCTAITLLLGLGISINYSKMLGKKDYQKAKETWSNGFFLTLFFSIGTSIILCLINEPIINVQSKSTNLDKILSQINNSKSIIISDLEREKINNFLVKSQNLSLTWANNYSYVLLSLNFLNAYTMVFISLLNSEGKNGIPTIFILLANIINVGLDSLLLLFTSIGILGAAIATVISWILSVSIFVVYIYKLNRKNDTLLLFSSLNIKKVKFDKKIILLIFAIGVSSFFRNTSTAIFSFTQQSIYGNITTEVTGKQNSYYLTILGAVNPIFNLFYSAIIGIIRGARTLITYNYAKNNVENIKKAFLISILMSIVYSTLFFILIVLILPNEFLWIFNITSESSNYNDAKLLLIATISQLPMFGLSVSGMLYFQSTDKPITSLITSVMYGVIIGIPGLFLAKFLSESAKNINYFIYAPLIIMSIAGILVFSYSFWHLFLRKRKIYIEY
ncbi:MAG: polysaccharide biosynthesis C-terminal domain-containing protein [Malacoplasma sp.]|nr:polysaccharide biosynthesis C-terminal domain-containing protein [Malacoplasma sp.]